MHAKEDRSQVRYGDETFWSSLKAAVLRQRFACKYFAQLDAEYESLCDPVYVESTRELAAQLRARHSQRPSWHVNHEYEHLIVAGLREAILKQRCAIYRARLLALASLDGTSELAQAFGASFTDDPASLRDQLRGALSEIQRLRHVRSEFERLRNRLFFTCTLLGLGFVTFFVTLHLYAASSEMLSQAGLHVVVAGLLGAYFSVLLRLGGLQWCIDYNANYHQVDRLFWNILVGFGLSLFEGAVGAYLLYTLFLAGAVQGSLFPNFGDSLSHLHTFVAGARPSVKELIGTFPSAPAEMAKLLVWSVAAGFSERLVPDMLSALSKDATKPAERAATATTAS